MIKFVAILLILLLLFGGRKTLAKLKSPKALNMADRLLSGSGSARKIVSGQAYGRGDRQQLDIWAPTGSASDVPVVVFFYGGGWSQGARADYGFVGRALAAQGFLVVIPDYHLAPQAHFPEFVEDCAAAVAWVQHYIDCYGGDAGRIALMGHSAGAYNAAMILLDRQWLARAGGDVGRLRGFASLAGPFDFLPMSKDGRAAQAMGRYRPLIKTQPIAFARGDGPPLWLASGGDDILVPPQNSVALAEAVQQAGGVAEVKIYPDMDHSAIIMALAQPFRGKGDVLGDAVRFLRRVTAAHQPTVETRPDQGHSI